MMRQIATTLFSVVLAAWPLAAWGGDSIELHVQHAMVANDIGDRPGLKLDLTPESKDAFGAFTTKHIGELVDLRIDGKVVMSPVVRDPILGGQVMVTGNFERGELVAIAKRVEAADAKVEAEVRDQQ
jgi:preprotein translocase subunit SecD